MMKHPYVKKFVNYVLNGLVISLPVFGTAYIIFQLFKWLDGIVPRLVYSEEQLAAHKGISGWGILVLLVVLFATGWIGARFINERLKGWFERILDKIPGVNNLYHSISDILSAFVGNKKKFDKPVLVKISEQLDIEVIGFITDTDLSELGTVADGKVAVYCPMSYSFSGHMIIVPARNIKLVDRNPVDVMKYTMSGGIVEIEVEDEKK